MANNIEILTQDYEYFKTGVVEEYLVGSAKYPRLGSHPRDVDRVLVVNDRLFQNPKEIYVCTDGLIENIIVSKSQFDKSRADGSDILMFEANPINPTKEVLLAYIGIAKRDLKDYLKTGREDKLYHYLRCKNIASYFAGHVCEGDFTGMIQQACHFASEEALYHLEYEISKYEAVEELNRIKKVIKEKYES